ncbi:arsenate reductase (glutaredoxin) [Hwanghaeella grinnelliae]|uniref:Arsenate reductase n=1 Tax=Hwanghaeella grinnelliae TaxID=2500179 RepID=A0A3S2Y0S9_9PROT|nr:arsenate reductase (glutaredoxin) [Hwanghaeella grinnelliae]
MIRTRHAFTAPAEKQARRSLYGTSRAGAVERHQSFNRCNGRNDVTVTIYHNPRCSKSRQTLTLLQDKGIEPEIVEYLKTPPGADEIADVLKKLGIEARALMRTKETVYKELGLSQVDDEKALIKAMAENPVLIERPVVIKGSKAAIGRPPEQVLEIL